VVYFAPNTAQGKYNALTTALADRKNNPSVLSCSWGMYEAGFPPQDLSVLDWAYQFSVLAHVTICSSSGDRGDGSAICGKPSVQFPASSPYVLACGGTHLIADQDQLDESVWDESLGNQERQMKLQSGGGFSTFFPKPSWQPPSTQREESKNHGRGVPDVAGKADMIHGYCLFAGNLDVSMGGTSAAAPMWAALVAILNQGLGTRAGYLTPLIYREDFREACRSITQGKNGPLYHASPGWNPCTGQGSPHGEKLLAALGKKEKSRAKKAGTGR